MAIRENTTPAMEKALNAAQGMFTANPRFLAPQVKHTLQAQERFFDETEKFAAAWFRRRQDATQTLIDAGRRVVAAGHDAPSTALSEITTWQAQSMQRMRQDVQDYAEMLRRCAGVVVKEEAETVQELSKVVKQATATSKSEPV